MGDRFHPGGLRPTHNFDFTRDQAGLWTGFHEHHCTKEELAAVIPAKGSPHHFMNFLGVSKVKITGMEGRFVKVMVHYAGFQASRDDEGVSAEAEFTLTLSTSEEPIETHPRYDDLSDFDVREATELARNPPKSRDGKKVLEPKTDESDPLKLELYNDLRKGLESYREPRVTWTKRWVSDQRPEDLNRIGEIDTPEGDPPAVAQGRDWLNAGLTSLERGDVFENELSWELSGRGGWDERYYGDE